MSFHVVSCHAMSFHAMDWTVLHCAALYCAALHYVLQVDFFTQPLPVEYKSITINNRQLFTIPHQETTILANLVVRSGEHQNCIFLTVKLGKTYKYVKTTNDQQQENEEENGNVTETNIVKYF